MKKSDLTLIVCLLLILTLIINGISGFIQVRLDLHRTTIHKYSAYSTLSLSLIHIVLHFNKLITYIKNVLRR